MITGFLCGLIVIQQLYWSMMTHKLLDKLMSRNYHEYQTAKNPQEVDRPKTVHNEPVEDLGALSDFRPL